MTVLIMRWERVAGAAEQSSPTAMCISKASGWKELCRFGALPLAMQFSKTRLDTSWREHDLCAVHAVTRQPTHGTGTQNSHQLSRFSFQYSCGRLEHENGRGE